MSRGRVLSKVGGVTQTISGISTFVGVSTFASDVRIHGDIVVDGSTTFSTQLANSSLANSTVSFGGISVALGAADATPAFDLSDATNYPTSSLSGTISNAQLAGSISNDKLAGSIANNKLANDNIVLGGVSIALGGTDNTPAFDLTDATNYPTSSLSGTITNAQLAGSIANDKLANSTMSVGGVTLTLGATDATPAFDLSDATDYPTSSLSGTITNAQLAGSIANDKLANSSINFGGITLALGGSDTTPAFDLSHATDYPTSSLVGTITNAQLAGSIANAKLANSTVSFGGVTLALGGSDATPALDLSDATDYPTSSLVGTITNAQLAGSIANSKLANSTMSVGGVTLTLGATDATPAFDLSDATNYPTSSLSGTITNAQLAGSIANDKLAGSIANSKLANSTITVSDGSNSTATALGGTITFAGTGNEVDVAESSGTVTIGLPNNVTIANNLTVTGNLQVDGSTTTINTSTMTVEDKNIEIAKGAANDAAADGAGITVDSGDGDKTWNWVDATDSWTSSENIDLASGKVLKSNTATILSSTTLGSSVVNSSLTSLGTISTGVWQGTAIANAYLANSTMSVGGVTLTLGATDATPAFNLTDATNYPTSSLSGTITNAQLAGSIANSKLANSTVSFGGISLALGGTDATPAFDLQDATGYPTSSLVGTITNAQLAGSIASAKLASTGVSAGTVGSSTAIPIITVNAQGQITATSTTAIDSTTIENGSASVAVASDGPITSTGNHDFTAGIDVTGDITGTGDVTITDTTADSAAGPEFKLFRNSASPADADYLGQIKFAGESDGGTERNYAKITGKILDASDGSEDGAIEFAHIKGGSQTITGRFRSDSLQLLNGTGLSVSGNITVDGTVDGVDIAALNTTVGNITTDVVSDTTPQLGGNLDVNGSSIVSTSNGNIAITPNGSGKVVIDGISHPTSDGANGQVLTTNGSGALSFQSINQLSGSGIEDVVDDTTPQLGGNLDVNGKDIVSTSNGDIEFTPDGTGAVVFKGVSSNGGNGAGRFKLNCENNSHGITVQGPPHSAGANYTLTLPDDDGSSGQALITDGSGALSWTTITGATNLATTTASDSVTITSSTGNNTSISEASSSAAGVMSVSHHDKLDGIESGATADQTDEEIQDIVGAMLTGNTESGITVTYQDADGTIDFTVASQTDQNFTNADHSKLDGIEAAATADQTGAEIKSLYEAESDTNAFTDALASKLSGIEASATADQTAAEIRTLVDSASDSNVFTDADHTKLDGIESNATADQTDEEIQDIVGAMLSGNTESGITVTYQDGDGTIDFAVASQTDENFTTADHAKLDGIEAGATADQSDAEIKTAYENNSDTNAFTDALLSKLNGIESGATADQTAEEIEDIVGAMLSGNTESGITVTYQDADGTIDFAVASQTDENFTTADHSKLDGIEAGATADQSASEILTLIKTVDGAGSGLDADSVDGIAGGSFLRSDADDAYSGALTVTGSVDIDNISLNANTITTTAGNLTIDSAGGNTTIADNLAVSGNLTVNGTTTTVNATTVNIADKNIQVATGAADDAAADGGGITIDSGDGDKTFQFEATGDNFGSSENMNLADGKVYKIDNTSVLSATTLGSNVVSSSLTSLGTISSGVWQGTAINDTYIGTIDNANKVSLSALNIDGGTDIGAALADADLLIVDDGAGGTNRKMAASRLPTYLFGKVSGDIAIASNGTATIQANSVALATDTTGNYVAAGAVSGNGLSGSAGSEGATFTVTSNATASNSGSTIVFRDGNGDFSAGTITASLTGNVTGNTSGSSGSCTGNSATATALANARTIAGVSFDGTANISLNNNAITNGAGYITSSGTSAACSGNAATATLAANSTITANNSTNETVYPVFVDGATGTQGLESDTGLSYNPSSNTLTTTAFVGALTGNVTGNVSGSSGSTTGNAATATKLATARTIAGVSFDGSANISLNNANITNGAGYVTANTQLSNEQVQDIVGAMVSGNSESGITVTYQDGDGTIDFSVASQTDNNFTTALKNKLDGIAAGATNVTNNNQLTNGAGYVTDAGLPTTGGTLTGTLNARAITPTADSTYDLGTNSVRWANIYGDDIRTGDLHLSNEHLDGGNSVDGSWGSYQIEEGEDDLFITNKRSGKKYRFLLQQV